MLHLLLICRVHWGLALLLADAFFPQRLEPAASENAMETESGLAQADSGREDVVEIASEEVAVSFFNAFRIETS